MALDDPIGTFSARPTVRIGGQELPLLSANIARFKMREQQGGMSSLELALYDVLSFDNGTAGYGATAASPLKLGAEIKVYMGETTQPQEIFSGIITGVECDVGPSHAPIFTVLAEDKLFKLRRKRRSKTYDGKSPKDVVTAIAGDSGLTAQVADGFDTPSATWVQMNESDLSFLRRIFESLDGDFQLVDDKIQVVKVASQARNTVPLALGDTLVKLRATADLAEQATEARVGSFDAVSGEPVLASVSSGTMGPGTGSDGKTAIASVANTVREHIGHFPWMDDSHGKAIATAAFSRRARRFVRADGTAQGNGAIRVGTWLQITGVNPFFANTYNVIAATHRFDSDNGYLTDFVAECAFLGSGA